MMIKQLKLSDETINLIYFLTKKKNCGVRMNGVIHQFKDINTYLNSYSLWLDIANKKGWAYFNRFGYKWKKVNLLNGG